MSLEQFYQKIKSNFLENRRNRFLSFIDSFLIFVSIFLLVLGFYQYIEFDRFININKDIIFNGSNIIAFDSFQKNKLEIEDIGNNDSLGKVMASKNGSKYYFSNCGGLSRIKIENMVYFSSEQNAINKGLEKSKTCK